MPWKERYTVSDERTQEDVQWPDSGRCAFIVVIDPSPPCGPQGLGPAELDSDQAHYGLETALPRMLDVLDAHRIRATFPVPAMLASQAPALARELVRRGHEVAAHGLRREDVSALEPHEEQARLARTTDIIGEVIGERPRGWYTLPRQTDRFPGGALSTRTIGFLIDAGYDYLGNSQADDIPHYWVDDYPARRAILALPYCYHHDDQYFIEYPPVWHGGNNLERVETLLRNWRGEFEAMRGTIEQPGFGRCFTMVVHPWLNGWGQRLDAFEQMLALSHNGPPVWNPTAGECARYWTGAYPAATALKLAPSIWQDHPGSQG